MKDWQKKLIKGKVVLSEAETAREFGSWYTGRWKQDYPDLYESPTMPSLSTMYRRRPRRPIYARRRRLTAKRAIVLSPSPARNVRARRSARSYGGGGKQFRFSRTNVGQRVGEGTTKRKVSEFQENVAMATKSIYSYNLTDLAKGDDIDQRERYIVNVRGFKIRMYFRNNVNIPIMVNWALVAGRGANAVSSTDFFRANGTARSQAAGTGGGVEQTFADINTDDYVVLRHKRFLLSEISNPTPAFNTIEQKSSWKIKEFYMPLKRQLRYEGDGETTCTEKVFFVAWVSKPSDLVTDTATTDAVKLTLQTIMYYKEPKN